MKLVVCPLFAIALAGCAQQPSAPAEKPPTSAEVLERSAASDWRPLDPENTLYLELATGPVIIELAPQFAPNHVANIRTLVREHYFDGLWVIRVQDNYVAQWGDPEEDPKKQKPLGTAKPALAAEFSRPLEGLPFTVLPDGDNY